MVDRTPAELLTRFQNSDEEDFIRLLVHDIRGPLSGMISASKLLNTLLADNHDHESDQLRKPGRILQQTADNMRTILDSTIEYDRIQRGEPLDEDD